MAIDKHICSLEASTVGPSYIELKGDSEIIVWVILLALFKGCYRKG